MRRRRRAIAVCLATAGAVAWGCGARPGEGGHGGWGTVGGGGGTEILDGGESGSSSGSGAHSGGSGGSGGSGASTSGTGAHSGSSGSSGGSSGASGTGSAAGSGTGTELADAGDAGTGGIVLTIPSGPIHLVSLTWTIAGPNTYQGSVDFGDAGSFEWVVGGILAAHGYRLSVTAKDSAGDPCQGTSAPFDVVPGLSTYTMITITCDTTVSEPADVGTGSVAIEAGVVASD